MALRVGQSEVGGVYVGSTPVQSVYAGSELVWSAFDSSLQLAESSKTVLVPSSARYMDVVALGGGATGWGSSGLSVANGGQAGKFAAAIWEVTAGEVVTIEVGAGGAGKSSGSYRGNDGESTVVSKAGDTLTAEPGKKYPNSGSVSGAIPGTFTYTLGGDSFTVSGGSPAAGQGVAGPWPGGGGGGNKGDIYASGASGAVWYRFRAN